MSYYGAKGGKTVGVKESKTTKVFKTGAKTAKSDGSSYSASYSASMSASNPYTYGAVVDAKSAKRE